MPFTAAAAAAATPGVRAIERLVREASDGLRPGLVYQLLQLGRDLKRLGATDQYAGAVMRALIEEIRVSLP
jgi:hypothetical protein